MLLRWLISVIGLAALKGEVSAIAGRVTVRALLAALVSVLWLTASGFAVAALTVWLTAKLGVIVACAIVAAGLAVIGLAIQFGLMLSARRHRSRMAKVLEGLAPGPAANPGPDLGGLGSMAIIVVAGYLLGRQLFRK